jgi:lipopolysaccharide transport system ATP-binding protein
MNVIEVENLFKKYSKKEKVYSLRDQLPLAVKRLLRQTPPGESLKKDEFWVINDLSFSLGKGEVLGIIGVNGAGKSTLLNILSGVLPQTSGRYEVHGRLAALIEITAGFHPDFTGRENVFFNGIMLGMRRREVEKKFDEIVDFSGVREFIDMPVKKYSSGMAARLGFSVAAHVNPEVLLVDEVLSVGDAGFQTKCLNRMKELRDNGVTIIFISHNIVMMNNFCDRLILLDKGRVIKEGPAEEVVPLYENLTKELEEAQLRESLHRDNEKHPAGNHARNRITDIRFYNGHSGTKQHFYPDEAFTMRVDYAIEEKIPEPVITVEIIRSDGVVCCEANSRGAALELEAMEGSGSLLIDIEKTQLTPGTYYGKVSVWDKEMMHPHLVVKKGVFNIESRGLDSFFESVFFLKGKWTIDPYL